MTLSGIGNSGVSRPIQIPSENKTKGPDGYIQAWRKWEQAVTSFSGEDRALCCAQIEMAEVAGELEDNLKFEFSGCHLSELPPEFPPSTVEIIARHNQLTTLPECVYALPEGCAVHVEDNPLSHETLQRLEELEKSGTYSGPEIHYSVPGEVDPRTLKSTKHV